MSASVGAGTVAEQPAGAVLRGIGLMSLATLMFAANDTLLKLATQDLSPINAMFYRGVGAVLWSVPLLLVMRQAPDLRKIANPWVLLRNVLHLGSVFCFMSALQHLPLGDLVALGQLSPALLIVGVAGVFGERIGRLRTVFVVLALAGALLLAQPGQGGFSFYVLFGVGSALLGATRDLIGRQIPLAIPVLLVVISNLLFEVLGAAAISTATGQWMVPAPLPLALLAGSALFLVIGHNLFFLSYRVGSIGRVAPFYYLYPVWSFLSGVLVFHDRLSVSGIAGIGLIVASGVAIVLTRVGGKAPRRSKADRLPIDPDPI
jgi:S-adenosylmethionine uptake transporter